jgi:hypothetical protein
LERNHSFEFKIISKYRMINHYFQKLKSCLENLSNESIWHKESEDSNSIGGIVVHLIEHINRNTARLRDQNVIFNQGIEKHFPDINQDKAMIVEELDRSFIDFGNAMDNIDSDQIDTYNIYHLVEHTGYHLGQIIDRTQRLTGIRFQFVQNGINERELKKIIDEELREAE